MPLHPQARKKRTTERVVHCASVLRKATLIHIAAGRHHRFTNYRRAQRGAGGRAKQTTKLATSLAGAREWDVPCLHEQRCERKESELSLLRSRYSRTQQGYTTVPPVSSRRGAHSPRNARMNTSETERRKNAGLNKKKKKKKGILDKCFFAWRRKRSPRQAASERTPQARRPFTRTLAKDQGTEGKRPAARHQRSRLSPVRRDDGEKVHTRAQTKAWKEEQRRGTKTMLQAVISPALLSRTVSAALRPRPLATEREVRDTNF